MQQNSLDAVSSTPRTCLSTPAPAMFSSLLTQYLSTSVRSCADYAALKTHSPTRSCAAPVASFSRLYRNCSAPPAILSRRSSPEQFRSTQSSPDRVLTWLGKSPQEAFCIPRYFCCQPRGPSQRLFLAIGHSTGRDLDTCRSSGAVQEGSMS